MKQNQIKKGIEVNYHQNEHKDMHTYTHKDKLIF